MKYKSALTTSASGSIDGMTASRNRGGRYLRARAIPTDPNTVRQQTMRAIMGQLVDRWTNTLTQVQRDAWNLYGANVPVLDAFGDPINLSGQQWYVKANSIRQQAITELASTIALVDDGPTVYALTNNPFIAIDSIDTVAGDFDVSFTGGSEVLSQIGGALLIFEGRPQSVGRSFFRGPWRLAGVVEGAVVPPTSPATIAVSYALAAGQHVWFRAVASNVDGRPSEVVELGPFLTV